MGRGNDNRDRRRGRGDQGFDPWGGDFTPPPSSYDRPRTPRPGLGPTSSGPETEAKVKWFNAEKGFGFVEMTDGSGEAFLHIRPVEAAGYSALEPGTTLVVRTGQGQKGPQVTEVVSVDESTATAEPPRRGPAGPRAPRAPDLGSAVEMSGTVKWYNETKGFGFIGPDGGGKDVFVHASALQRSGITALPEGQHVRMQVVEGRKGPEAASITLEG